MQWTKKTIPEYNSKTNTWTKKEFAEYSEFLSFLQSNFKLPGSYNFTNTHHWRKPAIYFEEHNRYTPYELNSNEAGQWFDFQESLFDGFICDSVYVPGDFYFYLNFCPIYDKIKDKNCFPTLWDSDYHYYMYLELAWYSSKDAICVKLRQKGYSLKHVSRLIKKFIFGKSLKLKIVGHDEAYVLDEWTILEGYKAFLDEHTVWYRNLNPSEVLNWENKIDVTEGFTKKKKISKGRKTVLKGYTVKTNSTKAVGGPAKEIYCTEAGKFPNLDKFVGFARPNIQMGSVKTGMIVACGAVGELKDCEPLRKYIFSPQDNGFLGVPDLQDSNQTTGFFCPYYWNYAYEDATTKSVIYCYDKDGNSDIETAKHYIKIEAEQQKKKSITEYKLWKSQYPETLRDAFDLRDDNIFPVEDISKQLSKLEMYNPILVEIKKVGDRDLKHFFAKDLDIVRDYPVKPSTVRSGAVVMFEPPKENAPSGLYYAGVDPIKQIRTVSSDSLMSCYIFKAAHQIDNEFFQEVPVAWYCGRHEDPEKTYFTVSNMLRYYNAKAVIENDSREFITWMILKNNQDLMYRRSELTMSNDVVRVSNIFDDFGVTTGSGKMKEYYWTLINKYLGEVIETDFMPDGTPVERLGIERIKDYMLLKELSIFHDKRNVDRMIAFALGLIAVQSNKLILNIPKTHKPLTNQPVSAKHSFGANRMGFSSSIRKRW